MNNPLQESVDSCIQCQIISAMASRQTDNPKQHTTTKNKTKSQNTSIQSYDKTLNLNKN